MTHEKTYPDFDPETDRILIKLSKREFLAKKPQAECGFVRLGGILHAVSYTDDNLFTILTPMTQIAKRN